MFHQVHGESKFSSSTESNFLRVKVVSFVNTKTTENDRNDQFVIFVRYFKDVRYIFFRDLNDLKIFVTQISCTLSTRKVLFIFFFFFTLKFLTGYSVIWSVVSVSRGRKLRRGEQKTTDTHGSFKSVTRNGFSAVVSLIAISLAERPR